MMKVNTELFDKHLEAILESQPISDAHVSANKSVEITLGYMKEFAIWKDLNYINYQMQDDKFYNKRDLLKHISEATVFTLDQLIQLFFTHLTDKK